MSVCSLILKSTCPNFTKFSVLPLAVAQFFSDDSAIKILPVSSVTPMFSHNGVNGP